MKNLIARGRVALLGLLALTVFVGGMGVKVWAGTAPDLADLVPVLGPNTEGYQWGITGRLGGPTLEFGILTANIGGQDWFRPHDPDNPALWLLREIYEYTLYQEQEDGSWKEIDRRRKPTICTIDDTRRGRDLFPCLRERDDPQFGCGLIQGISKGWADDYFRNLNGQWVYLGDNTGRFKLEAHLDPDNDLQRDDIEDRSRDGNPDNNIAEAFFTWDGETLTMESFNSVRREDFCPPNNE